MDIRPKDLIVKLGIKSQNSLNTYLGRSDFSHIRKIRVDKIIYLHGVTPEDIEKLKLYTGRKSLTRAEKAELGSKIKRIDKEKDRKYENLATKYQKYIQH